MKQYLGGILGEINAYRRPLLMYLLLGMLVLAPFIIWMPYGGRLEFRIAYLLPVVGFCVLAIASRLAFVLICLLLIAPAIIHQHLGRHWGSDQFGARAEAYFESPTGEIHEYLQSHVDAIDIAFLIGAALYAILLIRWTMRSGNAPRPLRRLAACAVVAGLIVFAGLRLDRYLKHFRPYEMASQVVKARERYEQLSTRNAFLAQQTPARGNCASRYDKIVIVLGESATTDHMSIFGYEKPTTPFALESGAQAFDALSPSNQTRYSLGMMLTRAAPGGFDSFYTSHSLVGELRNCGLHTLWISNQGRRGEYDSFSTSLAREADEQVFLNEWSWEETQLDGKIVEVLEEREAYRKTGQVTFIHLIGSHSDYEKRVPPGFGFQGTSDLVSQYDNTILYTDHVLSELYRRFAGGSLLFIYVSDHGQMVSESKSGSGFMPGYKEEFHTPLLVWTDDDAAVKAIRDAIGDSRLNLESFDDVVRYLVGMTPAPQVSTREVVSILTPDYVKEYSELESLSDD